MLKQLHAGATLQATAYDRTGMTSSRSENWRRSTTRSTRPPGRSSSARFSTIPTRACFRTSSSTSSCSSTHCRMSPWFRPLRSSAVPPAPLSISSSRTTPLPCKPSSSARATASTSRSSRGCRSANQVVDDGADRLKDGAKVTIAPPPGSRQAGSAAQSAAEHKGAGPHSGQHRHQQGGARQTSPNQTSPNQTSQ